MVSSFYLELSNKYPTQSKIQTKILIYKIQHNLAPAISLIYLLPLISFSYSSKTAKQSPASRPLDFLSCFYCFQPFLHQDCNNGDSNSSILSSFASFFCKEKLPFVNYLVALRFNSIRKARQFVKKKFILSLFLLFTIFQNNDIVV